MLYSSMLKMQQDAAEGRVAAFREQICSKICSNYVLLVVLSSVGHLVYINLDSSLDLPRAAEVTADPQRSNLANCSQFLGSFGFLQSAVCIALHRTALHSTALHFTSTALNSTNFAITVLH